MRPKGKIEHNTTITMLHCKEYDVTCHYIYNFSFMPEKLAVHAFKYAYKKKAKNKWEIFVMITCCINKYVSDEIIQF